MKVIFPILRFVYCQFNQICCDYELSNLSKTKEFSAFIKTSDMHLIWTKHDKLIALFYYLFWRTIKRSAPMDGITNCGMLRNEAITCLAIWFDSIPFQTVYNGHCIAFLTVLLVPKMAR